MLSISAFAALYIYTGILFAEVSRFGTAPRGWVYAALLIGWPLIIPVVIYRFNRGE